MKRAWMVLIVVALMVGGGLNLAAQDQAPATRVFFGPVLGVNAAVMDPAAFNTSVQAVYPNPAVEYFPVFTEMGVESAQVFALGDSKNALVLHETFLIAGLDQNMPVPSVNLLLGYKGTGGFEIGMGPHFTLVAPQGSIKMGASVMYWVGWWISSHGYTIPIKLAFVPLPSYSNPQVSLLIGFSFEALP